MLTQGYFNTWLYFSIGLLVSGLMGLAFSTMVTGSVYKSTTFELDRCQTRDSYEVLPMNYEFTGEYADLLFANQWSCLEITLIGFNLFMLFWRAIGVGTLTDAEICTEQTVDYFKKHRVYTTFTTVVIIMLFGLLTYYAGIIVSTTQLRSDGLYMVSYSILSVYCLMASMFILLPIIGLGLRCYNPTFENSRYTMDRKEGAFLRTVIV